MKKLILAELFSILFVVMVTLFPSLRMFGVVAFVGLIMVRMGPVGFVGLGSFWGLMALLLYIIQIPDASSYALIALFMVAFGIYRGYEDAESVFQSSRLKVCLSLFGQFVLTLLAFFGIVEVFRLL